MVGRSTELQALLDAYRTAGPDGGLLVLSGEAGIGKTRLAEEFVDGVRAAGASVLSARCFRGEESMAYGPFVEALRAAVAEGTSGWPNAWLAEVARLVPDATGAARVVLFDHPRRRRRRRERRQGRARAGAHDS